MLRCRCVAVWRAEECGFIGVGFGVLGCVVCGRVVCGRVVCGCVGMCRCEGVGVRECLGAWEVKVLWCHLEQ